MATTTSDWVLNPTHCHLKATTAKGRGVFGTLQFLYFSRSDHCSATQAIPPRTVIETSPVLLFGKQEYDDHGKHTLLDHYTFNWRDGRMALALGLGPSYSPTLTPRLISKRLLVQPRREPKRVVFRRHCTRTHRVYLDARDPAR